MVQVKSLVGGALGAVDVGFSGGCGCRGSGCRVFAPGGESMRSRGCGRHSADCRHTICGRWGLHGWLGVILSWRPVGPRFLRNSFRWIPWLA